MPVVTVEWWEGKTSEQKEKLITGITKAFVDIGLKAEELYIIIHDVPKTNWGLPENRAPRPKDTTVPFLVVMH